jgi:hypothetical protein
VTSYRTPADQGKFASNRFFESDAWLVFPKSQNGDVPKRSSERVSGRPAVPMKSPHAERKPFASICVGPLLPCDVPADNRGASPISSGSGPPA